MDAIKKYQVNDLETGPAFWAFYHWLEEHVSKEAAEAFETINMAEVTHRAFLGWPADCLTIQQKHMITGTKKEFQATVTWLKAEGAML